MCTLRNRPLCLSPKFQARSIVALFVKTIFVAVAFFEAIMHRSHVTYIYLFHVHGHMAKATVHFMAEHLEKSFPMLYASMLFVTFFHVCVIRGVTV